MHRIFVRLALAIGIALIAACGDPSGVSDGVITATRESGGVRLRNSASFAVHYIVVERESAALINFAVCHGPRCPQIPPRASRLIQEFEIAGYAPEAREAIVYWWRATEGRPESDGLRHIIVPL